MTKPLHTIVGGAGHLGEVRAFLLKYYGKDEYQAAGDPLHTVTTRDRFGRYRASDVDASRAIQRPGLPRRLYNRRRPRQQAHKPSGAGGKMRKQRLPGARGSSCTGQPTGAMRP